MHKSEQYDSVKGENEVALYTALESASKISFLGALKTASKVDRRLVSAIESAPDGTLKLQAMMHVAICIKTHKKVHLRLHFKGCT